MGLQEQQLTVKFSGGVETKMDSKSVPSARLLALENGVFTKAVSIKKRNGYEAFSKTIAGTVSQVSGARALGARDRDLVLLTEQRAYSHQADNDEWVDVGPAHSVVGTDRPGVHTGTQQSCPDHATNGGITVFAWEDSRNTAVWFTVVDEVAGTVHRAPAQIGTLTERPRCVAVGDVIHVYCAQPTQRYVNVTVINPSTPTAAPTTSVLVDDLEDAHPVYDACSTTRTGSPALMIWHVDGGRDLKLGFVDKSGVLGSPGTGHPSVTLVAASLADSSPLACAFQYGNGDNEDDMAACFVDSSSAGKVWTYNATVGAGFTRTNTFNAQYATPSDVQRVAVAIVNDTVHSAFEDLAPAAPVDKHFVVTNTGVLGGVDGTAFTIRSVGLASRAFVAESQAFAYFVHDTTYFNVYLGLRLTDARCVARAMAGGATGLPARSHQSSVHVVDDVATCSLPHRERLTSAANDKFGETGVRVVTLDFADDDARRTAQLGRGLYMGGACPQHYDGQIWNEAGFHVGPERLAFSSSSPGAGAFAIGSYEYRAWYEWTDAQGEVHRGPTSIGTTVTLAEANTTIALEVPTLRVTDKSNVRVCVARARLNDPTEFFRVSSLDPTTDGDVNGYIANDKTIDSVSFQDEMTDVNLAKQEPLYTNGGILSNDPTSVGHLVVTGNNRLFYSDLRDPNVVRFTQELADGFGAEITPELVAVCDPFGGAVGALAVVDDKVVVFKETAIFAFNGDGPLPNGDSATRGFSAPRLVTSDVGCTDPASVVLIPTGLLFKSAKGIYHLDRSMVVTYVGAPVEAYNAQKVTRAIAFPDRSQVVFLTDSGSTLLYDHLFGQWSTFTNHEGVDGAVVDGVFHYLRADGRVFRETIGSYADDGVRITLRLETAWVHLWEHLQGFQRFWKLLLLGTWGSPHQLGIQYQTDFEEGWTDPVWLDATGDTSGAGWLSGTNVNEVGVQPIVGTAYGAGAYGAGVYGGDNPNVYQWRLGLHVNGQSIRFRFEDFEKSGLAGATFELTEMTIVGGAKKPDNRPFTAARSA